MEAHRKATIICRVPKRHLDDRIRELCARALSAEGEEFDSAILALRSALREHNARLRRLTAVKLARPPSPRPETSRKAPAFGDSTP
jgi:hypothetical protein